MRNQADSLNTTDIEQERMQTMKRPLVALVLSGLLSPLALQAADTEGNFAVKGAGLASCEQFVAERGEKSNLYWMFGGWLDGYLTAINQFAPDTYDIAPWESTDLLAALIENYCKQNPEQNFFSIANALAGRLMEDRLQTQSPPVEAKARGQSIRLYQETLRRAQQALKDRGHYTGTVDGLFGPQTQQAIEDFQRKQGLKVTGLPDQLTLLRLLKSPAD